MRKFKSITVLLFLLIFTLFSCKKAEKTETQINLPETATTTSISDPVLRWYYFSRSGIVPIETPRNTPQTIFRPWTETMRVSGAAQIDSKSYMLVNRLGLLTLPDKLDDLPELKTDVLYFTDTTASNLLSVEGYPVFHVYRNSFFNSKASVSPMPFLIQYRTTADIFFPLLKVMDLELPENAETVHLQYDGTNWIGSFKSSTEERTQFNYLKFFSFEPLISLTGSAKKGQIQKEQLTQESFKNLVAQRDFTTAPKKVQNLLSQIPENIALSLEYTENNPVSPVNYIRETKSDPMYGKVKNLKTNISTLFYDGTFYFAGATENMPIVNDGKPVCFRLPKMPSGFLYTDFIFSGSILYVAWEEELFYETGRSGFLAVDLRKVFY
ncbi:MAG: hypothetical protein J6T84_07310 [Spirochaetaceae bacterium]|nr:hypothetical protein [Spirochaetaceae bacterium]